MNMPPQVDVPLIIIRNCRSRLPGTYPHDPLLTSRLLSKSSAVAVQSFALARDHLPRCFVLFSQNLTRQKQVSEKSAEMDGSIQIVDQL